MPKTARVRKKSGPKADAIDDGARELDGLSNLDEPDEGPFTDEPPQEPPRPEELDQKRSAASAARSIKQNRDDIEDIASENESGDKKVIAPAVEHVPKPPQFVYSKEKNGTIEGFMDYWRGIPARFKSRLIAYVYRNWPVLDPYYCPACASHKRLRVPVVEIKPEGKHHREQRYQCPACGWSGKILRFIEKLVEPLNDSGDVLHRWGTGDYHLKLNDTTLKKTIAMCFHNTVRDFEHYPPAIVNKMDIDTADPQNTSFVNWLRSKGVLPGLGEEREGDDMGNEALADALRSMTETVVKQRERDTEKQPVITPEAQGTAKGMEIIASAAQSAINLTSAAATKALNDKPAANASDPLSMSKMIIDQVATLSKALQPAPVATTTSDLVISTMKDGFKQISDMQNARIEALEKSITDYKKESVTAAKPRDIGDDIERVAKLKDSLGDLFGFKHGRNRQHDDDDDDEGGSLGKGRNKESGMHAFLTQGLPLVVQGVAVISAIGANIWYNIVAANKGSEPQRPPTPEEVAKSVGVDPALVPAADPFSAAGAVQGANEGADMYKQFLQKIHKPLLFHLHQEQEEHESNGADFADWLISNVDIEKGPGEGRKLYNKILAAGRTSLEELLSSYPPLWMELQQVPQLAGQFIEDFLHRDEIRKDQTAFEEQEAEDEDEDDELVEENLPIGGDDGRYSGGHSGGADAESLGSPANGKAAGAGAAATAAGATLVQEEPASGAGKRRRGTGHQPIQPIRET